MKRTLAALTLGTLLAGAAVASLSTTVDGPLSEPDTASPVRGIKAVAHTNNDYKETTGNALYDLDIDRRSLFLQVPANAGTVTLQGYFANEKFGQIGFDIASGRPPLRLRCDSQARGSRQIRASVAAL